MPSTPNGPPALVNFATLDLLPDGVVLADSEGVVPHGQRA